MDTHNINLYINTGEHTCRGGGVYGYLASYTFVTQRGKDGVLRVYSWSKLFSSESEPGSGWLNEQLAGSLIRMVTPVTSDLATATLVKLRQLLLAI